MYPIIILIQAIFFFCIFSYCFVYFYGSFKICAYTFLGCLVGLLCLSCLLLKNKKKKNLITTKIITFKKSQATHVKKAMARLHFSINA